MALTAQEWRIRYRELAEAYQRGREKAYRTLHALYGLHQMTTVPMGEETAMICRICVEDWPCKTLQIVENLIYRGEEP